MGRDTCDRIDRYRHGGGVLAVLDRTVLFAVVGTFTRSRMRLESRHFDLRRLLPAGIEAIDDDMHRHDPSRDEQQPGQVSPRMLIRTVHGRTIAKTRARASRVAHPPTRNVPAP